MRRTGPARHLGHPRADGGLPPQGENGAAYTPPACTGTVFPDVRPSGIFDPWIEDLAARDSPAAGGGACPGAR